MIRRTLAAGAATSLAAALLAPWAPAAYSAADPTVDLTSATATPAQALDKGTVLDLGDAKGPETYIVQLESPAIPTRALATEAGASKQSVPSAAAYGKQLLAEQGDLESEIAKITNSAPKVLDSFTHALNGIAVRLTRAEAQSVARIDGVSAVQVDFTRELTTDRGPAWIGAPTIWDGTNVPGGVGSQGEGVIVGVLDTGINPANPSFADTVAKADGGDGYDHTNPLGKDVYKGVCATNPAWGCNDKLIGYWNMAGTDTYDDDGHGSHTASTSAGNQVKATVFSAKGTPQEFSVVSTIRGVAPHANIIGYDVCDGTGCQGSSIVGAIEQAIKDKIDVINYSIGAASPSNPWTDPDALAFLNARAAGINVATSAGNAGPGPSTVGGPADTPWMTAVGATTHDRKYIASVTDLTSEAGAGPANIAGTGLSGPTPGSFPLVYAGDAPYDNKLCKAFAPGTDLKGKIIVCERGDNGRVEKGQIVAALGAEGMILVNDAASGDSLNGDAHALPSAQISYANGVILKTWMTQVTGEKAALSGAVADIKDSNGDVMGAFSSRGPNRAVSMMSPSVSAPGVDILAAAGKDNNVEWQFISGTSMASPHTAGALALLKGVRPSWTPAQRQSALMTTAERNITDSDGTKADWFDMGSGRIELRRAAKAGLVLDETLADYLAANPAEGGDVRTLNTASMADNQCLQSCSWTRSLTGTSTGVGTWTVSVENLSAGLKLTTDVSSIAVTDGGNTDVKVTAQISPDAAAGKWLFGTLVLTPPAGSTAPVAHLPVGVSPSAGVLPKAIDITTRRDAGSQVQAGLEAIEISALKIDASGLVPEQSKKLTIPADGTNSDPFNGDGSHVEKIEVPQGATSLIAKLSDPTATDFDMYVGKGEVSKANVVCTSATGGSAESCTVAKPGAGTWWVLVQNWEASTEGGSDTTDLLTAVVTGDKGNLRATGPQGNVPAGTPFDIRTFWNEPAMEAGQTWYGALTLGTSAKRPGNIGIIPVTVRRIDDDVTKTSDVKEAAPGEVITYTVDVAPNVSNEDLNYTITDTLPAGTTYVDGSATDGASFTDGVVAWTGTLRSAGGQDAAYKVTSSLTDTTCINPFTGKASYLDLAGLGIEPQAAVTGDGVAFTTATAFNYGLYGQYGKGLTFTDDGFLVFGNGYGGTPGVTQSIPNAALPNNVAAALWQDMVMTYDAASGAGVSLASDGKGGFIVEYDNMRKKGDPTGAQGTYDFQVIALPDTNDYVVAYDNLTGPLTGVTIGTENADGSEADALVNKGDAAGKIANGSVVCMKSTQREVKGTSFSYQVKVDATVGDKDLTNKVVHITDDPGAKPASSSHTVAIKGSAQRTDVSVAINPNRITTGGTTAATASVFTTGATPATGQVQFLAGTRVAGTGTLDAAGRTTVTLSGFTEAGTVPVTAKYVGDAANAAATSTPVNLVVTAPDQPMPQVRSKILISAPHAVRKGHRAKLKIVVTAPKVTPTGTVTVKVRGAVKTKTYTLTLNQFGIAKLKLGKVQRVGKIKVKVLYTGDAAVKGSHKEIKIRAVRH